MAAASTLGPPSNHPESTELLDAVLHVSLTGVLFLRPLYEAPGAAITDFAYERLNSAAQQLLGLPERPALTLLAHYPAAIEMGVFEFYREAFATGQMAHYERSYQHQGLDKYFRVAAQRHGERLLVSFDEANERARSGAEEALRQSQAREQAARQQAERQRGELERVFEQAPVAIAVYRGPQHIIELANPTVCRLWGRAADQLIGKGLFEALPEVAGMGYEELLAGVLTTGQPYVAHAMAAQHERNGRRDTVYWDFVYVPTYERDGRIDGVMVVATDVTEQVEGRHRLEEKERQTNFLNEELQAANEEILANNAELECTQQQLRQLNEELEGRVAERTHQLDEQQNLLRQILSQLPAAVATLNGPEHRFVFANARYQELVASRAELGKSVAEAMPELQEQGIIDLLDHVYTSGQPFIGREIALMLALDAESAAQHYFDFTYQPLTDSQGRVQGILVFAIEVTEQVRTRRQTETLQAAMLAVAQRQQAERENVYQLFGQTPAAICLLRELNHRIEYLNPAYQALFPGRVLVGKTLAQVQPEARELVALMNEVYASGTAQTRREVPVTYAPAAGAPAIRRYYDFTYQAYREEGRVVGVSLFGTDVTDQVLAHQQVQTLNAELQAANHELNSTNSRLTRTNTDLDTFVYSASHDLKSPITNIEGLLLALRQQLPPEALQAELVPRLLSMMDGAVGRFQQTLGHLTDVSRLQQQLAEPAETVDLPALVEAVRLDILPELLAAGATLQVEVAECPKVQFAAKNLRSILYNLLSNAVKYRVPGRTPLVQLRARCAPRQVVLEVQDNGLGLSAAQQTELFQLFRRLHSHVAGSGVGLYMVKKMVDNSGGTLAVHSQPGVGSTFTVTLPTPVASRP